MKKILVTCLLLLITACCSKAHAAIQIDTSGLSEAQKAELVQQAENMKASKDTISKETVDKWTNFAEIFGKTISTTAKEVGVQVNEFVKTPVGQMTAGVIIYRYVGKDILNAILYIVGGVTCLIVGGFWARRIINSNRETKITYNDEVKNIFGNHPIKSKIESKADSDHVAWATFVFIISALAFIIFISNAFN